MVSLILISDAERKGAYLCPKWKSKNIHPAELGDSPRSRSCAFFWVANLTQTDADLLSKHLLDDAELIVSLSIEIPNRGKIQQNEDLTPIPPLFFYFLSLFPYFHSKSLVVDHFASWKTSTVPWDVSIWWSMIHETGLCLLIYFFSDSWEQNCAVGTGFELKFLSG